MSSGKSRSGRVKAVKHKRFADTAERIRALRERLGDKNQADLAKRLKVTQAMVSAWESGKEVPSASFLFRLGSLASYPDSLWFWRRAGIEEQAVIEASNGINKGREAFSVELFKKGDVVLVPRFRETRGGREDAGAPLPFPTECIPNPTATIALVVDELSTGVVESPRGIVLIDTSWEGVEDLEPLWGRVVAVRCAGETSILHEDTYEGVYIGRLFLGDSSPLPFRPGMAMIRAALMSLDKMGWALQDVGRHEEPDRSPLIRPDDTKALRAYWEEMHDRAASKLRLFPGIRVLGKVIGRLTGQITAPKKDWK